MKLKFNLFFVAITGILFLGLFGLLEINKEKAGFRVFNRQEDMLASRWIVAEAVEAESNKNLSEEFKTLSWQFLTSGGFVEFEEQLIGETGNWSLRGQELRIRREGQEQLEEYIIDKLTARELLLSSAGVKIRLLKLDD